MNHPRVFPAGDPLPILQRGALFALIGIPAVVGVLAALQLQNANQLFTVLFALGGIIALLSGLRIGLLYGVLWLFSKAFWLRLAFHLDATALRPTDDWLGPAPALFLIVICGLCALRYLHAPINRMGTPLRWLLLFVAFALFSLAIPGTPLWVKLAGLQRNILPTMAVAIVGLTLLGEPQSYRRFCRVLMIFGIASVAFGIVQLLSGLPFWELTWFRVVTAARDFSLTGWLTVGPGGLEFRVYSCYYSYTEFFFTTVGILLVNLPLWRSARTRLDRNLFIVFAVLFVGLLFLTLERMPLLMLLFGALTVWSLAAGKAAMKRRLVASLLITLGLWLVTLLTLSVYLQSGVDKLVRLAELTNPFRAASIQDRITRQWDETISACAERPWGWGLGSGSQTIASEQAAASGTHVAPHNEILQKALELGVVGAILFVVLLVSQGRFVLRRLFRTGLPPPVRGLLLGYAALMAAYVVCGMVNLTFSGTMGVFFWLVTGATWGVGESLPAESRV